MKEKQTLKRRVFTEEFKSDVTRMVLGGRSVKDVSESMGIKESLIHRWKKEFTENGLPDKWPQNDYLALQKRLREVEMERDILKKALSIFSRQT
jgi:transposase